MGSSYDKDTGKVHFNVFSKNASHIEIYFYLTPFGADEVMKKSLVRNNDIWSLDLPLAELKSAGFTSNCVYYGYRTWGPNWEYMEDWNKTSDKGFICDVDDEGNRFNPNKLLIDPYSKELSHDPQVAKIYIDPNVYIDNYYSGANRNADTGKIAPKSMLFLEKDKTSYGIKPKRHLKDDIIYEVNLRGLTMMDKSIPKDERGTYKAASIKAAYLKELGVTAVEFLPIHEFADEQNDDNDPRGDNYWGYMTLNFFSPNRRYSFDKSPGGPTREFKQMIKAFHEQGIKVFLDVVYNHTGEGILKRIINQGNPSTEEDIKKAIQEANHSRGDDNLQDYTAACIMSFTGLDNSNYYYLRDGNKRYEGRGGCGGNLKYDNEVVRKLIYDSLKYWKDEMGVDGFRFDLAPVLSVTGSNGNYWPDTNTTIFEEISNILPSRIKDQDNGADLIAEPWGEGSSIDWLDKFPNSWAVWNKAFRDIFKTSMNKYGVAPFRICNIANVSSGSSSIIKKKPWNSINYFVSHDDCNSLRNIFSYNEYFHLNEAGIKNDQITWNQGNDPSLQKKAVLNAFTLMMFSAGVPMFTGGDEFYRAISPYHQGVGRMNMVTVDGPDGYVDFQHFNKLTVLRNSGNSHEAEQLTKNTDELYIFEFVKKVIDFRSNHECLRPENYFKGERENDNFLKDITWYQHNGLEIDSSYWDSSDFVAYRISAESEKVANVNNRIFSIYLAYNRSPRTEKVLLPSNIPNKRWYRLIDTDNTYGWMSELRNFDGDTLLENEYVMHDRSILVLIEK